MLLNRNRERSCVDETLGSNPSSLRLGISGCGRVAELGYLPAIRELDGIELVAATDPDCPRRERLANLAVAQGAGSPVTYATDEELLRDSQIDALLITSPVAAHLDSAAAAARSGVPVLVEKPPAANLAGAVRLTALSPAPWLSFNRRFGTAGELTSLVPESGFLTVELELSYRRASWQPYVVDDEALLDIAPHLIDLGLFVTNSTPIAVRVEVLEFDRVELVMQTTRANVRLRCAANRPYRESIVIRDHNRRRIGVARTGRLCIHADRLARRPHPLIASLKSQLDQFRYAVAGAGGTQLATAADGVQTMRVIDAARDSHARSGIVMPLGHDGYRATATQPRQRQLVRPDILA